MSSRSWGFRLKSMYQCWQIKCNWLKIWERTAEPFGFELSWALLSLGEIESRKAKLRAVNSNIEIALYSNSYFLQFTCTMYMIPALKWNGTDQNERDLIHDGLFSYEYWMCFFFGYRSQFFTKHSHFAVLCPFCSIFGNINCTSRISCLVDEKR